MPIRMLKSSHLLKTKRTMGLPTASLRRSKQVKRSKKSPSTKSPSAGGVESSVSLSANAIDGDHADGHGVSSDTHRRGGTRWSASMKDVADQLHSLRQSEPHNLKSCMKVATLQESLDTIRDECKKAGEDENPHKKTPGTGNRLSLLQPMKSMRNNLTRRVSSRKGTELLLLDAATEDDTHLPPTSLRNVLSGLGRVSRQNFGSNGDDDPKSDSPKRMPAQDKVSAGDDAGAAISVDRETKVNFTKLHFRQYTIRAGANPGVSKGGAAIELGWQYEDTPPQSIHEYEEAREPRKHLKEMKLSRAERERRLLDSGVSLKEIHKSTKRVNQAKQQRKQTLEDMGRMRQEYKKELLRDRFRRFFRLEKSESVREDELWDEANRETLAS